ncbi:anti-sigma factor domain-containing protein [Actinomycetes bacterium M1A6_2h]
MTDERYADLADLAYPYAVDAVDDAERADIEAILRDADASARADFDAAVHDTRETMAVTSAATAVTPPPALRARILDAIADAQQESGSVTSLADHRARRSSRWRVVAAAAAAVVIVGVGGTVVSTQLRDDPASPPSSQVLAADDVRTSTADVTGGGTATVTWSRKADAAVVTFDGLASPGSDRVFELWLIEGTANPRSVGLVAPDAANPDAPQLITGLGQAGTFAVSVEPDGGSPQPTTTPITAVTLDA